VAFGAIGIPIVVAAKVTDLDMMKISQICGRQLPFLSVIVPLWLAVTMSGFKAPWKCSGHHRGRRVLRRPPSSSLQLHGPYLPDIASSIVTILGLGSFLKSGSPRTPGTSG
jgi:lactate permease